MAVLSVVLAVGLTSVAFQAVNAGADVTNTNDHFDALGNSVNQHEHKTENKNGEHDNSVQVINGDSGHLNQGFVQNSENDKGENCDQNIH
jgi:hypothetical protein